MLSVHYIVDVITLITLVILLAIFFRDKFDLLSVLCNCPLIQCLPKLAKVLNRRKLPAIKSNASNLT